MVQLFSLSDTQRAPFIFYCQETRGMDDPAYNMAAYLDTAVDRKLWKKKPTFDKDEIYKESCPT